MISSPITSIIQIFNYQNLIAFLKIHNTCRTLHDGQGDTCSPSKLNFTLSSLDMKSRIRSSLKRVLRCLFSIKFGHLWSFVRCLQGIFAGIYSKLKTSSSLYLKFEGGVLKILGLYSFVFTQKAQSLLYAQLRLAYSLSTPYLGLTIIHKF